MGIDRPINVILKDLRVPDQSWNRPAYLERRGREPDRSQFANGVRNLLFTFVLPELTTSHWPLATPQYFLHANDWITVRPNRALESRKNIFGVKGISVRV
jgi:hypothetical protein